MVALPSNAASASRFEPLAYGIFALLPTTDLIPSNKEVAFEKLPATLHVPGIFSLLSAKGPINAMVPDFFIGNALF